MDFLELLKRAFRIALRYRALWIFGFFLALCSGGGSGGGQNFNLGNSGNFNDGEFGGPYGPISEQDLTLILAIAAGVICLILLLVVIGVVVRSVTRTALVGMVDQIELGGTVTVREGWRIGWSRRAFTLFLINLLVGIPVSILVLGLLLLALSPLALLLLQDNTAMVIGIIGAIGLFLVWLLFVFLLGLVLTPLSELGWRYAVLQKLGAVDSLKASYGLIRAQLKDVAITVLLLIGVGIAWGILSFVLAIFVLLIGAVAGAVPGLIAYAITQNPLIGVVAGLPIFLVVVVLPLTFVTGLYMIFQSAFWTLVYRQLTGSGAQATADVPAAEPDNPTDESAGPTEADDPSVLSPGSD